MSIKSLAGFSLALLSMALAAEPHTSQQEREDWFNSRGTDAVNEGKLVFLTSPPTKAIHHHQNRIRITPGSLTTGWVHLTQCHTHLDAVADAQITFREGTVRKLRVLEAHNIKRAWVEGTSVQLKNISHGAQLCLSAQTRALIKSESGSFTLGNGPYMRKFLDGYYPMQVSLQVNYPSRLLRVIAISPTRQTGFEPNQKSGQINIEALFEGELRTKIKFERLR